MVSIITTYKSWIPQKICQTRSVILIFKRDVNMVNGFRDFLLDSTTTIYHVTYNYHLYPPILLVLDDMSDSLTVLLL